MGLRVVEDDPLRRERRADEPGAERPVLPASSSGAVLALQRGAGNQAVVTALATGRTPPGFDRVRGPATGGVTEHGPMLVVVAQGPDQLDGFPGVLGVAQEPVEKIPYPSFVPGQSGETGVSFSKAALAAVPEGIADVLRQGRSPIAHKKTIEHRKDDTMLYVGGKSFVVVSSDVEELDTTEGDAAIDLSPTLYGELVAYEQDHLDDFKYAYQLSVGAVVDGLNAIAGTQFESAAQALTALASKVPKQLVPTKQGDPAAWAARLKTVFTELCGQSKRRDYEEWAGGTGEHRPKGWKVTLDPPSTLLLSPVFKGIRTPKDQLIKLSDVLPAPTEAELARGPQPGGMVRVKHNVSGSIFVSPSLTKSAFSWEGVSETVSEGCKALALRHTSEGMCLKITKTSGAGRIWSELLEDNGAGHLNEIYADVPLEALEIVP